VDSLAESLQCLKVNANRNWNSELGTESMKAIGRLKNLNSLVISGGENSNPEDFFDMVASGQLLKLRILHLTCPFVTPENVEIVMTKCPELNKLLLLGNSSVSLDSTTAASTSLQILSICNSRYGKNVFRIKIFCN
jgi:hypothetical protein